VGRSRSRLPGPCFMKPRRVRTPPESASVFSSSGFGASSIVAPRKGPPVRLSPGVFSGWAAATKTGASRDRSPRTVNGRIPHGRRPRPRPRLDARDQRVGVHSDGTTQNALRIRPSRESVVRPRIRRSSGRDIQSGSSGAGLAAPARRSGLSAFSVSQIRSREQQIYFSALPQEWRPGICARQ